MIYPQNEKIVTMFLPQSVATNGTATGTVNTLGFDYARIILDLATASSSNTDVAVTLKEGDGTSTAAYVTATDMNLTTVAPNTSNAQVYCWYLDLRKRKKFLQISYSPSASGARVAAAIALLGRAEQPPTTAAGRGLDAQVVA